MTKQLFSNTLMLYLALEKFFKNKYDDPEVIRLKIFYSLIDILLDGYYAKEGNYFMFENMSEKEFRWMMHAINTQSMR